MFSEFGRHVQRERRPATEAGTDHGAGGLMFAMGSAVRGGFAADWPGCEIARARAREREPGQPEGPDRLPLRVLQACSAEWLDEQNPQSLLGGPAIEPLVRGDGYDGRQTTVQVSWLAILLTLASLGGSPAPAEVKPKSSSARRR